jgi:hypothetical protein
VITFEAQEEEVSSESIHQSSQERARKRFYSSAKAAVADTYTKEVVLEGDWSI